VKPVTVAATVDQSCDEVFDFMDVLGDHERFTDHFLVDWETSGPRSGVGARARMRVRKPGPPDWLDMEVIVAERPRTTVEESVSARGRRRTRGTYVLRELPGGGTRISFELDWITAPLSERLAAPLTRWVVQRNNQRSLERLAEELRRRSHSQGGNR
jgi:hypothetical protein